MKQDSSLMSTTSPKSFHPLILQTIYTPVDPGLRKSIYIPVDPGLTFSSLVVIDHNIYCSFLEHITDSPPSPMPGGRTHMIPLDGILYRNQGTVIARVGNFLLPNQS